MCFALSVCLAIIWGIGFEVLIRALSGQIQTQYACEGCMSKYKKEIPKEAGYYWVKLTDDNGELITRIAEVTYVDYKGKSIACVDITRVGEFTEITQEAFGFDDVKFGEAIPLPTDD